MSKFVKELSEEVEDLEKKIEEKKVNFHCKKHFFIRGNRKKYRCIAQKVRLLITSVEN